MSIELAALVPHTPRMCFEDKTPDFQRELVKGMKRLSRIIERIEPDAVVLISCHWTSSFDHLIDAAPDHQGVLTALECPNLISDVPYSYPGDTELAMHLAEAGAKGGFPSFLSMIQLTAGITGRSFRCATSFQREIFRLSIYRLHWPRTWKKRICGAGLPEEC